MGIIPGRKDICLRGLFYAEPRVSSLIEDKEKYLLCIFVETVDRLQYGNVIQV